MNQWPQFETESCIFVIYDLGYNGIWPLKANDNEIHEAKVAFTSLKLNDLEWNRIMNMD